MKKDIIKSILLSGIFLLLFIVINIFLSSLGFIFKISISKWHFIISLVITLGIMIIILSKMKLLSIKKYYNFIIAIILPIFLIGGSLFLNSKVMDFTYDGNTYHQATIGLLKEGWNPLYQSASEFDLSRDNKIGISNSTSKLWVETYARATHIFQANAYAFTGNINSGKSINTLSILALFLIVFSYLSLKFKKIIFPLLFSICTVTYPVISAQYLTVYIDFFVYIYLFLIILSFFILEFKEKKEEEYLGLIIYSCALLMMINIKYNAFAYAGIFCLGYYIYYIVKLIKVKDFKKYFIKFSIISACCVIVGVFVIGLSVYPKNFINYGHPFYPLYGKDKVDIIINNQPYYFENKTPIEKYVISMFSEASNIIRASKLEAEYKIPLSVNSNELKVIAYSDTRISGNGVLFSGIFIISLIVLVGVLIKCYKDNKKLFIMCVIPLAITFIMIFGLSESWWARYFPQTYFIVLVDLLLLYYFKKKRYKIILGIMLILILINNGFTFAMATGRSYVLNVSANNDFRIIKENMNPQEGKIVIKESKFIGAFYNIFDKLKDYNIVISNDNSDFGNSLINGMVLWKWEEYEEVS